MTLWLLAVIPDAFLTGPSVHAICAPVCVLPAPGGPWIGNTPPARWGAILTAADNVVSSGNFIGRPPILGAVNIKQVARRPVRAVTGHAVRRNMLADPDKGLREHLRIDHLVCEHGGRMYTSSVLDAS